MTIPDQFYEEQRALLQRIHDAPATECEKAFREIELVGKSQPKEWEPTLCGMHGLMWRMFEYGWKAKAVAPHCSEGDNCACWGDTEQVRHSCVRWRHAEYKSIRL